MKNTALIAALTLVLAALLTATHALLSPRIQHAQELASERRLLDLLPPGSYNNRPLQQPITLAAGGLLQNSHSAQAYLACLNGQPSAVLLPVTSAGYEGPIQLLVAISPEGRIIASKVLSERETKGLADFNATSRQHWLTQLNERTLEDDQRRWQLRSDGGQIDQIAGATRTSRAINQAQQRALEFFAKQRTQLLERQP